MVFVTFLGVCMMIINILAGGPVQFIPDIFQYHNPDTIWVGVDRGVYELLKRNIIPDKAFGDFDSIGEYELAWVKEKLANFHVYPSEKDETDLELALNWVMNQQPEKVRLFGATGGRIDHLLGNIQLLLSGLFRGIQIEMIDKQNYMVVKRPGTYEIHEHVEYPYISFLPVSETVKNITLTGFKYPLTNKDITLGTTLCISNELNTKTGTFSFTDGILIMVRSHD